MLSTCFNSPALYSLLVDFLLYDMLPTTLTNPSWFVQLLYFDQDDNGGLSLALQVNQPFFIYLSCINL